MTDTSTTTTLTPSGMGAARPARELSPKFAAELRSAALSCGLVLVRGLSLSEDQFQDFVRNLGQSVEYKYREGQGDLLRLDATREEGKITTGRGPLPLHTDGLLVGQQTDLIILYAADFDDAPGSGETFVCDQLAAWAEMPDNLRRVLDEREIQYLVPDRQYYPDWLPDDWYTIPSTRDYGRVRSLALGMPFPPGVPYSWKVRVRGMGEAASDAFFDELDRHFRQPRYLYQHRWTTGDLIVIDNQRTLHGRTSIGEHGTRLLFRGQLTLPTA